VSGEGDNVEAEVFLDARGILRVSYSQGVRVGIRNVRSIIERHKQLAAGRKVPVLVDSRHTLSMSLEARRAARAEEVVRVTSRMAIIVDGPISVVIGHFFLRVAPPRYPTRLFTDPAEAEAWLLRGDPPGSSA